MKMVIETKVLKAILNAIGALNGEALLEFSPLGIKSNVVDLTKSAMLQMSIGKGAFDFFSSHEGVIAVDIFRLQDISSGLKDAITTIEIGESKDGVKIQSGPVKIDMRLLDPSSIKKPPRLPDLDFSTRSELDVQRIKDGLNTIALVMGGKKDAEKSAITIQQDQEMFKMSSEQIAQKASVEFSLAEVNGMGPDARTLYGYEFLSDIFGGLSSDKAKFGFSVDSPCQIEANIGEHINLKYLLAPRLEEA